MDQKTEKPEYVWFKGPHFPEGLYDWVCWAGERRERIKPVGEFFRIYEVDSSYLRPATPIEIALYGLS